MAAWITSTVTFATAASSSTVCPFKSTSGSFSSVNVWTRDCATGCCEIILLYKAIEALRSVFSPSRQHHSRLDKLVLGKSSSLTVASLSSTLASLRMTEVDQRTSDSLHVVENIPLMLALDVWNSHWPNGSMRVVMRMIDLGFGLKSRRSLSDLLWTVRILCSVVLWTLLVCRINLDILEILFAFVILCLLLW